MSTAFASFLLRPLLRCLSRKAQPQKKGAIQIAGIRDKVRILWDPFSVPHVFAVNEDDLFLAQGYLHAQERLWQMDFNRRFLCGRLGEIFGEKAFPGKELSPYFHHKTLTDLDYFMRLMGIRNAAQAALRVLPEEFSRRLSAYSEGINRYIEGHLKRLPLEFLLLRYQPEPWRPEDSLIVGKGFALFLSTSLLTRLTLTAISDKLRGEEAKVRSLYPTYPVEEPCITRFAGEAAEGLLRFVNGTFQRSAWAAGGQGSNNWVVAPWRSLSGKAILCNDPHLRMTCPSVWYLMHLKSLSADNPEGAFEVWGGSIPGSPCVHIGHNRWIAWGVTAALCDDVDLYRERTHPGEPDLYLVGQRWVEMECEEERIGIRGGKEIRRKIRRTRHGPVISDFTGKTSNEEVLAFKWTAHEPSREFLAVYGLNRARNWDEFLQSLSHQVAPTLNYVYADVQGNIGYTLAGKIPLRPQSPSLLPLPGWSGECDWEGYIPFHELPRLYNPPEGLIATANNRIVDHSYGHYLSDLFEPPYRIWRLKELLTAKEKFSLKDMAEIQQDAVSIQAQEIIRDLAPDLEEAARKDPRLQKAARRLIGWDGTCSEESIEASLFHVFYQRLRFDLLAPDLGEELFCAYVEIFNQALLPVDQILRDPQSPWFASRARRALVETALREACNELGQRLGTNMEKWRWGRLHSLRLEHPLGQSRLLRPFFSIGPFPAPGDWVTINMGFYRHSDPYQQVVGPSLRMIVDLSAGIRAQFILPSGQSGHPFSPHYRDQTELWRHGESISMAYAEHEMEQWPLLILAPSPSQTLS